MGHEPTTPPIAVTQPTKVLFPRDGITKRDVVDYYVGIADRLLPHLAGRPLTLERYPDGIDREGWIQRNAPDWFPPIIGRLEVPKVGGRTRYPVITDLAGLVYLVNLATITFHVPPVVADDLTHPDVLVFDLDGPEDAGPEPVRRAAALVRDHLEGLGIPSYVKTTGSAGYHVHVFVVPELPTEAFAATAKALADELVAAHPDELTSALRKRDRGDRVFVDWLRNRFPATAVAPWSLRARPGAPIAAPIRWEDLPSVAPRDRTLRDVAALAAEPDPWQGRRPISLVPQARRLGILEP
ncbi:MAG TPA: ATP-dependent DNA ligase [Actinobacteria bacterium]|nr:ATP-dependent DNA ligase [Actinomycetota bacterium]